jgi:hypothetical protein
VTADLQKTFGAGTLDGLYARLAYTRTVSRDLTSSPSAIAFTAWSSNQTVSGPNVSELGYGSFDLPHRILGIASYRLDYLGLAGTTLSMTYSGNSGNNFSYAYSGDLNGDGLNGNDLLYVPADRSEIALVTNGSSDTRTLDEIWTQLDAFIDQDAYLSSRRGQYVERGGARTPWVNQVDLGIRQEVALPVAGGRKARVELSFDIANFGNLLNSSWGMFRAPINSTPIVVRGRDASNVPQLSTPTNLPTESFRINTALASRWQALFGAKVSF